MAKDESFDITTGCDLQEVDNAVNQAKREITNRFDFKNILVEIDYDRSKAKIDVHTSDEYKLNAIWEVLVQRLVARNVPLKNVTRGKIEQAGGSTVRQEITLVQSIDTDLGKKIVRFIKDQKFKKAQAQVQGEAVRVSSPSREELQSVIKAVKGEDWGIELKFGNYR
jgi:cyclic-di-GMP-binding protein